ncbi:MAG: hypothetical protein AVDCRST_MAG87-587 [uncultured Thermomicrobiales bacterium]|uniref:Adenylate kinase n=1 Tax=uncultured Thermomicrobiales bacterium TaxID=1645740 RepID=A0A6J4UGG3_9BACT|nr:MAG: hypothetical protein AVDCRST_MAG87-587 [uncultured Thermomicrobiales bacterium]
MRRIHVIGGPGSGKTTVARRLALAADVPCVELDVIGYDNGAGAKRPLIDKLTEVDRLAAQPSWVAEGMFLWWTEALSRNADIILWLDPPWRIAASRIIRRHARASLAGTNRHRGIGRLVRFVIASRAYCHGPAAIPVSRDDDGAVTRAATEHALEPVCAKVVRCRRNEDVEAFLARWSDAL